MLIDIESKRLILKKYCIDDLYHLHQLKTEPLVWEYSDKEIVNNINETKNYLGNILSNYNSSKYDFQALFLKDSNDYIGEAGILAFNNKTNRAVIGYNLLPKYWGYGYATEITQALVRYLFEEQSVERIEALVVEGNAPSQKVLEKAGFKAEGLLRNFTYIDNEYKNVFYYGIIREDYF